MPKIIENLQERLIEEARRQVMAVGYAAVNIRDIARNCGVGTGTVYNYFPSKDALIAQFLLRDWQESLGRIRLAVQGCGEAGDVLLAVHRELNDFSALHAELFRAAQEVMPEPPRRYHAMLRGQIAQVLRPWCGDDFAAEFAAEALLTWTVEGKTFEQICGLLLKVMA